MARRNRLLEESAQAAARALSPVPDPVERPAAQPAPVQNAAPQPAPAPDTAAQPPAAPEDTAPVPGPVAVAAAAPAPAGDRPVTPAARPRTPARTSGEAPAAAASPSTAVPAGPVAPAGEGIAAVALAELLADPRNYVAAHSTRRSSQVRTVDGRISSEVAVTFAMHCDADLGVSQADAIEAILRAYLADVGVPLHKPRFA